MSNLLIVRTHKADQPSLDAYDRYAAVPGLDVTFVCDEINAPVDAGGRRKLAFDGAKLDAMGLYQPPRTGWRCGDYFYYIARAACPDHDFYWMIEPDVVINFADVADFFAKFRDNDVDFIAMKVEQRDATWSWYPTVAERFEKVFGCVFPLSRLSGRAIDTMLAGRQAASRDPAATTDALWANDEAFVASTIGNGDFRFADLNDDGRKLYLPRTFNSGAPTDSETLAQQGPDNLVYHPVRDFESWLAETNTMVDGSRKIGSRGLAMRMRKLSRALMRNPATSDARLIPLIRAADALENPVWAGKDRSAPEANADLARTVIERLDKFKPEDDRPAIATAFVAEALAKPNAMHTSAPKDFALRYSLPVTAVPVGHSLPYAWDIAERVLVSTLHLDPAAVVAEPFLYGAQRKLGHVATRMTLRQLDKAFGVPNPDAAPIFIFSLGRTGSTLFNILLGTAIPRSISEPDTLTQLAQLKKDWIRRPDHIRSRLLWHSISAFYHTRLNVPDDGILAIKLRSQVNALAAEIMVQFPKATYVFMIRERAAWARSTYRSFRQTPDAVVKRLLRGVATLDQLRDGKVDLHILSYEGMVADPEGTLATILGHAPSDEIRARIATAMARDSQAGTGVDRARTAQAGSEEADWLAAFEAQWAAQRPAAAIERLGLDL